MASAPATPKNKRLSGHDRDTLKTFAKRQIEATQDRSALSNAYEFAADAVAAEVEKRWPAKDMKVLAKYDAAAPDRCIYVSSPDDVFGYGEFCFREGDKRIPLRLSRYNCRRQPIALEGDAAQVYAEYARLKAEDEQQVKTRYRDFAALIDNTANFNALAEAWPAAEALRSEIVGSGPALSILSNEVRDRLKADPAMALAA